MRIVLDTNVLVSALRSKNGASHRLLRMVGKNAFDIALSVPLFFEYEDAATRLITRFLTKIDLVDILDYLCSVAKLQPIFFLWRPLLSDPKDDMVLEVALAAACDAIVTHNLKDFGPASTLGIAVLTPLEFLRQLGELP